MKKNVLLIAAISSTIALASCGGGEMKKEETAAKEETKTEKVAEEANWMVDPSQSSIKWTGGTAGANVYSHYGMIKLKGGQLATKGGDITGGNFVVDMTTINPKDDGYSEENPASKLVGHLATGDFFNIEEYPESKFEVVSADGKTIKGNLTIRGNTNPEVVEISKITMNEDGTMTAMGTLVFDRQEYDVAWEHYLEDTILSDDIELEITLVAKKA